MHGEDVTLIAESNIYKLITRAYNVCARSKTNSYSCFWFLYFEHISYTDGYIYDGDVDYDDHDKYIIY